MKKAIVLVHFWLLAIAAVAQPGTYVIATYTYSSNTRLASLEPLAAWLTTMTGQKFRAVSYPSVQMLHDAILQDSVDFAFMNVAGYLLVQRNHPGAVSPFLNLSLADAAARTSYAGCIIALKKWKFRTAAGLSVASASRMGSGFVPALALVNPASGSGNLVPRLIMNQNGLPFPDSVFRVHYTGSHRIVVEEVLSGKTLIGGCGCAEVDSARVHNRFDEFAEVIDSFDNIPLGPLVAARSVSYGEVAKVADALVKMHLLEPALFRKFCSGWTEFRNARMFRAVDDRHFDPFRQLLGNNENLWKIINQ